MIQDQPLFDIRVLDKGYVQLGSLEEDVLGTDNKTVNAARASYGKSSKVLDDRGRKLMARLGRDGHTSPTRHSALSLYIKCPLFVARQWRTHVIAAAQSEELNSFNEISGRYTEFQDEFYYPDQYYVQSTTNKQASAEPLDFDHNVRAKSRLHTVTAMCYNEYKKQIEEGVSREDARIMLPQNLYTQFMWTASVQALAHFIQLRNSPHAQRAIRLYAEAVEQIARAIFPESIALLLSPTKPTPEQLALCSDEELRAVINQRYLKEVASVSA
jgi:thymidylate synthase (FAD)